MKVLNQFLGAGAESKLHPVLGAGDASVDGDRLTGGIGGFLSAAIARLASASATGAVSGVFGVSLSPGSLSAEIERLRDPRLIGR